MGEKPLSVALGVVRRDDDLLLIRRDADDYDRLWALPGGKIEHSEHPLEAAVREIREETGIQTIPASHEAIVSELFLDKQKHFLLHICQLDYQTGDIRHSNEGKAMWHPTDSLETLEMVTSDRLMLEKLVGTSATYATCRINDGDSAQTPESFTVHRPERNDRTSS